MNKIWIKPYLSNRSQSVTMGSSQSHFVSLDTGVPQCSVLGPLLFSIYTFPVGQLIKSFGILHQQYADGTQLFISISPAAPTAALVEQCLTQLHYINSVIIIIIIIIIIIMQYINHHDKN